MVQDMGNTFLFLVHTNFFAVTTAGPASAVANGVEPPAGQRGGPLFGGDRGREPGAPSGGAGAVASRGRSGGRASMTGRFIGPVLLRPSGSRWLAESWRCSLLSVP